MTDLPPLKRAQEVPTASPLRELRAGLLLARRRRKLNLGSRLPHLPRLHFGPQSRAARGRGRTHGFMA